MTRTTTRHSTAGKTQELLGSSWFVYLCIMGAGFVGACLRYLCGLIPLPSAGGFPTNTLLINIVGCYCIFLVFQHVGKRMRLAPQLVKIINTGLLGAFTTLSAFCVESIGLYNAGEYGILLLYVVLTFVLSFAAVLLAVLTCDILAMRRLRKLNRRRAERHRQRAATVAASVEASVEAGPAASAAGFVEAFVEAGPVVSPATPELATDEGGEA